MEVQALNSVRRMEMRISGRALFHAWWRGNDGVSALEFGLFAPILFFGLLATADLGLALYQRMTIDHVLRAGAQAAMDDPGQADVLRVLESTASKNFAVAVDGEAEGEALSLTVNRYFACAEDPDTAVAPSTFCAGLQAPNIYYRLNASAGYDGIFLPIEIGRLTVGPVTLGSAAQVQVR